MTINHADNKLIVVNMAENIENNKSEESKSLSFQVPKISMFLSEPMISAAFLVFGMIALVLSIINFTQVLRN